MCLVISYKHINLEADGTPKPFVHDKDILVFKSLDRHSTPINMLGVTIGSWSTYPTHEYDTPVMRTRVTFKNNVAVMEADTFGYRKMDDGKFEVGYGIHAAITHGTALSCGGNDVFFAIIPAGTEFYIGTMNDIVAKKLVLFETTNDFRKYAKQKPNKVIDFSEFSVWLAMKQQSENEIN